MNTQTVMPPLDLGWNDDPVPLDTGVVPLWGRLASQPDDHYFVSMRPWQDNLRIEGVEEGLLTTSRGLPSRRSPQVTLRSYQPESEEATPRLKWLGHVTEVFEDGFRVEMKRSDAELEILAAEFALDELQQDDRAILSVGIPVVWAIFTQRRNGTEQTTSHLYLRRCPQASPVEIAAASKQLNDWFGDIKDTTGG